MDFQILQAGEAFATGGAAVRLLIGVCADMDEHLVPAPERAKSTAQLNGHPCPLPPASSRPFSPGIEASTVTGTAFPVAAVPRIFLWLDVVIINMIHQILQELEELVTLQGQGRF